MANLTNERILDEIVAGMELRREGSVMGRGPRANIETGSPLIDTILDAALKMLDPGDFPVPGAGFAGKISSASSKPLVSALRRGMPELYQTLKNAPQTFQFTKKAMEKGTVGTYDPMRLEATLKPMAQSTARSPAAERIGGIAHEAGHAASRTVSGLHARAVDDPKLREMGNYILNSLPENVRGFIMTEYPKSQWIDEAVAYGLENVAKAPLMRAQVDPALAQAYTKYLQPMARGENIFSVLERSPVPKGAPDVFAESGGGILQDVLEALRQLRGGK